MDPMSVYAVYCLDIAAYDLKPSSEYRIHA
jgi:hypothetical protein